MTVTDYTLRLPPTACTHDFWLDGDNCGKEKEGTRGKRKNEDDTDSDDISLSCISNLLSLEWQTKSVVHIYSVTAPKQNFCKQSKPQAILE